MTTFYWIDGSRDEDHLIAYGLTVSFGRTLP